MLKKIIAISLLVAGLSACQDRLIESQKSNQTTRYGKTQVAFLLEKDLLPGCDFWKVFNYRTKDDGLRYVTSDQPKYITICKGEVLPSKTEWHWTEQNGKVSTNHSSSNSTIGGEGVE